MLPSLLLLLLGSAVSQPDSTAGTLGLTVAGGQPPANATSRGRVLVVSTLGPGRSFGCGVREFVLIVDLRECGYDVDIVTGEEAGEGNHSGPLHRTFGWMTETPREVFRGVRWFTDPKQLELDAYADVFIFGWLWEHRYSKEPQLSLLPRLAALGPHATLVLDDVPTVRCAVEENRFEAGYCSKAVPHLLAQWANASRRVLTLTEADVESVRHAFQQHGVSLHGPILVWPLRLRQLARLQVEEGLQPAKLQLRKFLTMVASDHDVNVDFLAQLFASGAVRRLCDSNATLSFVGSIGGFVDFARRFFPGLRRDCLATEGVLSGPLLERFVLPRTLALLNPFFQDVGSGISVKSFEAVAAGLPLVTSAYGLRGLEGCGAKALALSEGEANDPVAYADFVHRRVYNATAYEALMESVRMLRGRCVEMQERQAQCTLLQ